ncbi:ornithine carbamoyltransferase [Pseudonocardia sp. DSM 110487]|uniref:ornithine carbamoyltransferase n=1 Tax=Pseudonocardia sp. DSM 110487 TaxID=2865833 RepID=UPI001C6A4430|nr:ornithine carbamoyltransferase [Pseudonocardia sp. DSM 110487]QYN34108.1 ornithine carbamoyltransferase [Pseudonocardia sp. DSM 110487]
MTLARPSRSLLTVTDLGRAGFVEMLDLAADLKADKRAGRERRSLVGRNIALVFEKDSTRTRCAFEVAAYDQGAHVTYLGPAGSHLGREESVADTARVLGAMFDGIEFRGFAQSTVEELSRHAGVPVWNGLTDEWHPTQMLADVLTMREHQSGEIEAISYCFLGDGRSNVARSLLITGAMLGMDVRIAAPRELWPPESLVADAQREALVSGARVMVTDDTAAALESAAFVYTDVWVSMGEADAEWERRVPLLTPYRVTAQAMAATGRPDTRFLHCLPAVHDTTTALGRRIHDRFGLVGAEVTDDVFGSAASVVFQQAENRLHTIKAVLVAALGR